MPTNKDLGRAIRRMRQAQHLTIKALALEGGISPRHLGVIERGYGNPRLETLLGLADALGVTLGQLMRIAEAEGHRA
jgi:XRE family aerobic/anaerobic benzoate catabolism transcriptional regulator